MKHTEVEYRRIADLLRAREEQRKIIAEAHYAEIGHRQDAEAASNQIMVLNRMLYKLNYTGG